MKIDRRNLLSLDVHVLYIMHSETLLSLFLSVLPTLLRSYPTGQARRKAASATHSSECKEVLGPGFVACFESPD